MIEGGISADEYQEICYDGLFSLIDDLLESPEDHETIRVATDDTYIFMQDNAPRHKAEEVLDFSLSSAVRSKCHTLTLLKPALITRYDAKYQRFVVFFMVFACSLEMLLLLTKASTASLIFWTHSLNLSKVSI